MKMNIMLVNVGTMLVNVGTMLVLCWYYVGKLDLKTRRSYVSLGSEAAFSEVVPRVSL